MAALEELTVGSLVEGLDPDGAVKVIAVSHYGSGTIELTYKKRDGHTDQRLLYRDDESGLSILKATRPWSFTADSDALKLASEAYRIHLAHIFDPYLAVHTSSIEPLPHQITAVYDIMLRRQPLRFILADDPGAGKTIMTGLLLKELILRGDVRRCLIVTPGSLVEQWQDEMYQKFGLRFDILTKDRMEASVTGNAFEDIPFCIARLDHLARNDDIKKRLSETDWDLVVVDEAHKMAASVWGGEVKYTKRFLLGRLLSSRTRHFLLLTATPHNGKEEDFELFLSLVDQDRFERISRASRRTLDVSDVMRRLVKEELLTFEGKPLFPERIAYTLNYDLSPEETALYADVTEYVRNEFNRADQLGKKQRNTVGFALTILQRRLASSSEAIYQSLRRRRERLEMRLREEELNKRVTKETDPWEIPEDWDELDDDMAGERETLEERITDEASAARTIEELQAEIGILKELEHKAADLCRMGQDRKWDELSKLLQENETMHTRSGDREKIIVFTEHRDTLRYLSGKIRSLLGNPDSVVTIHGGMRREERRKAEEEFRQNKEAVVLVATDAAGEGINLQRAHLMVNYDLPWNPNRIEQRFGRIHRIGQTEVCYLWNLVAKETREGEVFDRLFRKLEREREALGGKIFDILGKISFDNKPLRELLIEAIRYGNDPNVRARLDQVVDSALDQEKLKEILRKHALTADVMDMGKVAKVRETMERMEAHRLQPYFIERFFLAAFQNLGGSLVMREEGRYEIRRVPALVRARSETAGWGMPVASAYQRICFEKARCHLSGKPPAQFVAPGHPLMDAVTGLILEKSQTLLKQGALFIDDNDLGEDIRFLSYIQSAVQDGIRNKDGTPRIVSEAIHFVEINDTGEAKNGGYAPYLDYRTPTAEEKAAVLRYIESETWLTGDLEKQAEAYAVSHILPGQFQSVKTYRTAYIEKIEAAVKNRLFAAVQYWDSQAAELAEKEKAGKKTRLSSQNAKRRADELAERLEKRMAELGKEKIMSCRPPLITGGALIIPRGLLDRLMGRDRLFGETADGRKAVEMAGMRAVMAIEKRLGYEPFDISKENRGYDICSRIPEEKRGGGPALRFIEVKGRQKGSTTVTVTVNEILTALNQPDQFILALVEVDGAHTQTTYLARPFKREPEPTVNSINYDIEDLIAESDVLWKEENS